MHACTNKQKIPKKGKTKTPKRNEKEIKKLKRNRKNKKGWCDQCQVL